MTKSDKIAVGVVLTLIGAAMFASEVRIYSWSSYRRMSAAPAAVLILLVVCGIFYFATRNRKALHVMAALAACLLIAIIMSTHMYFSGSLLTLALVMLPICMGAGLILSAVLGG